MSEREATIERLREKVAGADETEQEEVDLDESLVIEKTEEKETKRSSTREYVVLGTWKEIARIEAGSAEAALKVLGKGDGEYAVVPARNWTPFTVKT